MFIFSIFWFMGGEGAKILMQVGFGSTSSSKKLFMTFSLDDAGAGPGSNSLQFQYIAVNCNTYRIAMQQIIAIGIAAYE